MFRSLVYNKAAVVLHMLRRLIGDEAFFRGLRQFYARLAVHEGRAPTRSREAFEEASGRSLARFFQRWIREFAIPDVRYSTSVQGDRLLVVFEQDARRVHDFPVTVTIEYASGNGRRSSWP